MSGACFPDLRPRALVVGGVHRGAFGEQKLCSLDAAEVRRRVEWRLASGGFRGHDSEDANSPGGRKLWECGALDPINRQTNDACFGLHIFKTVHIHKHIGQVSMHLFHNITFDEKNAILTAFSMMMRPVRTMSSIR